MLPCHLSSERLQSHALTGTVPLQQAAIVAVAEAAYITSSTVLQSAFKTTPPGLSITFYWLEPKHCKRLVYNSCTLPYWHTGFATNVYMLTETLCRILARACPLQTRHPPQAETPIWQDAC